MVSAVPEQSLWSHGGTRTSSSKELPTVDAAKWAGFQSAEISSMFNSFGSPVPQHLVLSSSPLLEHTDSLLNTPVCSEKQQVFQRTEKRT